MQNCFEHTRVSLARHSVVDNDIQQLKTPKKISNKISKKNNPAHRHSVSHPNTQTLKISSIYRHSSPIRNIRHFIFSRFLYWRRSLSLFFMTSPSYSLRSAAAESIPARLLQWQLNNCKHNFILFYSSCFYAAPHVKSILVSKRQSPPPPFLPNRPSPAFHIASASRAPITKWISSDHCGLY